MKFVAAKIMAWIGLIVMTAGLVNGFINGDFFQDGKLLFENPWGVMSLIDLYVGFTFFSAWIVFREKHLLKSIIWTVLMMVLGFFTASLYLLIVLYGSDNWDQVLKGKRLDESVEMR